MRWLNISKFVVVLALVLTYGWCCVGGHAQVNVNQCCSVQQDLAFQNEVDSNCVPLFHEYSMTKSEQTQKSFSIFVFLTQSFYQDGREILSSPIYEESLPSSLPVVFITTHCQYLS